MSHTHLTDDELVTIHVDGVAAPPDAQACSLCAARQRNLANVLREVSDTATMTVDAAFPPERLARQRARILQRIEHYGRQARVLAFPTPRAMRPSLLRPRSLRRWVAGAAAAGLIVGAAVDRMVHEIPSLRIGHHAESSVSTEVRLRASSDSLGDDELLREIELAVGSGAGPAALRTIADVTPHAWDVQ